MPTEKMIERETKNIFEELSEGRRQFDTGVCKQETPAQTRRRIIDIEYRDRLDPGIK